MPSLYAETPQKIATLLELRKPFHAKQIYANLMKGQLTSFDQMTDVPLSVRQMLSERFSVFSSKIINSERDDDGAAKLALKLEDGLVIECVLLTSQEGELTACLSSQSGCAMGCKFCRTGTLGLKRNLSACEIVEQFMQLQNIADSKITHVVFMGMGEPLANIDNVLTAITFLHDPSTLNISHRRITISTCGFVPGIIELSKRDVPVRLAVSLVIADDQKRSMLMPVNKTFNLEKLKNALVTFQKNNSRRFTFEYCMIADINIGEDDADKLARFCHGFEVIVNLIPFNPCPELDFRTPTKMEINAFTKALDKRNINYTIRISRGRSIKGACGQLAARSEK